MNAKIYTAVTTENIKTLKKSANQHDCRMFRTKGLRKGHTKKSKNLELYRNTSKLIFMRFLDE